MSPASDRVNGVAVAIVTDNKDPERLGRLQVSFPWHTDPAERHWARMAVPMAGKKSGTWFLPDVGEEVLVAFERGETGQAYVVGALWSRASPPPAANANGANDVRVIRSRSGHALTFDDSRDGRVQVALNDGRAVTLDKLGIAIDDGQGNRVTIASANGAITIQAAASLTLRASSISIEAAGSLEIRAGGALTIKGAIVRLN
jgi:phage baseplate assembly protein V